MIGAESRRREGGTQWFPTRHLDRVALAIVKADRLNPGMAAQCPGETGRRVLAAGEQYEGPVVCHHPAIMAVIGQPVTSDPRPGGDPKRFLTSDKTFLLSVTRCDPVILTAMIDRTTTHQPRSRP
jgi:hypothetical protein